MLSISGERLDRAAKSIHAMMSQNHLLKPALKLGDSAVQISFSLLTTCCSTPPSQSMGTVQLARQGDCHGSRPAQGLRHASHQACNWWSMTADMEVTQWMRLRRP